VEIDGRLGDSDFEAIFGNGRIGVCFRCEFMLILVVPLCLSGFVFFLILVVPI
jgi:hypothetical protein